MTIATIARNTFGNFLRNRMMVLLCIIFICVVLLMMTPMFMARKMRTAGNAQQMQTVVLGLVSTIMQLVSAFGSFLAVWAATDAVSSEMKSGTILAVMARPIRRWQFLAGKYAGVQLLMCVYVLLMLGVSYLLAWLGGERIQSTAWVLICYPLVRYAIYSAIALMLVTVFHPVVTYGIMMLLVVLTLMVSPGASELSVIPKWIRIPLYAILPSTELLSEDRFLTITKATLKQTGWLEHLITLAYGLDYALICLLLAMWLFRHRSLTRD